MLGLRTQETNKFIRFFSIVQEFALKQGKTFFLDAGNGNDIELEDIEGENLQGWLISKDRCKEFDKEFSGDTINDAKWGDFFCFAEWGLDNNSILIKFI